MFPKCRGCGLPWRIPKKFDLPRAPAAVEEEPLDERGPHPCRYGQIYRKIYIYIIYIYMCVCVYNTHVYCMYIQVVYVYIETAMCIYVENTGYHYFCVS